MTSARLIFVTVMSVCWAAGRGAAVEPPPVPDFKQAVDYVKWYRQQIAVPDEDNALAAYACFLYQEDSAPADNLVARGAKEYSLLMQVLVKPVVWRPEEYPELEKWIQVVLPKYRQPFLDGAGKKAFAIKVDSKLEFLADLRTPALANGRVIGQMMVAKGWQAKEETIDLAGHIAAIRADLAYGSHLARGLTSDEQFTAMNVKMLAYDQIKRTISSRFHGVGEWRAIRQALTEVDDVPLTQAYARSLCFAEASALQIIQAFSRPGEGDQPPVLEVDRLKAYLASRPDAAPPSEGALKAAGAADPRRLVDATHVYFERVRSLLLAGEGAELAARLQRIEMETLKKEPALELVVVPVGLAAESTMRNELLRRMVHLYTPLVAVFKAEGGWPESLDQLESADVNACRTDPYSGKDLKLKEFRGGRVIYSVGPDGQDDGGDEAKDLLFGAPTPRG